MVTLEVADKFEGNAIPQTSQARLGHDSGPVDITTFSTQVVHMERNATGGMDEKTVNEQFQPSN